MLKEFTPTFDLRISQKKNSYLLTNQLTGWQLIAD